MRPGLELRADLGEPLTSGLELLPLRVDGALGLRELRGAGAICSLLCTPNDSASRW